MVKRYLIVKLLTVNLLVAGFAMAVVWLSIDTLAAGYFVTLMEKYHISPEPAHAMFVGSVHRYLVWSFAGAMALAIVLSYVINRRILTPLTRMSTVSREIAAGEFSARVPVTTADEVGQLARAFNRMAENLEKIEQLRRTLMIDVAHELRTPLTNIRGYLEALNDGVLPPAPQTLSLLQNESLRLAQLVEDVLELARADAAGGKLQYRDVVLEPLLDAIIATFAPAIEKKGLSIQMETPPGSTPLRADPERLTRILRNLLDNAVQYAPPQTTVNIQVNIDHRAVHMEICNPAPDLSPLDLPYLFERFYRGEKSRSRHHGGAGIGLAIVKELVTAHGGTVAARLEDRLLHMAITLPNPTPRQ